MPASGLSIRKVVRIGVDPALQARKMDVMRLLGTKLQSKARAEAAKPSSPLARGVETGRLLAAIVVTGPYVFSTGKSIAITVRADPKIAPHAIWQEEGTGIYGPTGVPIVPKSAKFMVWEQTGRAYKGVNVRAVVIAKQKIGQRRNAKGKQKPIYEKTYRQFAREIKGSRPKHFMLQARTDPTIRAWYKKRVAALAHSAVTVK